MLSADKARQNKLVDAQKHFDESQKFYTLAAGNKLSPHYTTAIAHFAQYKTANAAADVQYERYLAAAKIAAKVDESSYHLEDVTALRNATQQLQRNVDSVGGVDSVERMIADMDTQAEMADAIGSVLRAPPTMTSVASTFAAEDEIAAAMETHAKAHQQPLLTTATVAPTPVPATASRTKVPAFE